MQLTTLARLSGLTFGKDMRERFWLVTTDHLTDRIWFRDDEDFKVAMNLIALLSVIYKVDIIAFILMSNHVHFLLGGDINIVKAFIARFKKDYSQYYSKKYGSCGLLRRNSVDFRSVTTGDKSFERAVAYIQMNCVAANICLHPSAYPWGTGDTYFRVFQRNGQRIGDLSGRARARLLHSRVPVPDDYIIDELGFIDPASYVPAKFVESVFRTPKRMDWFLRNSSKAKLISGNEGPSFNDQIVAAGIKDMSISLFRKSSLSELNDSQTAELFRQVRYRFSSDPAQMARVSGITYDRICTLLESL